MAEPTLDMFGADEALLLMQLLCTRLCHDLAGPVGAVAAGVELAGTDPAQMDEEILALIGNSSASASRKLKFLRGALGVPAAASGIAGLQPLMEGYLEATAGRGGAPVLTWFSDEDAEALTSMLGAVTSPLVLNMGLLVVEGLPVCQRLAFVVERGVPFRLSVTGYGEPQRAVTWRADVSDAVSQVPSLALSAKTIQPHIAKRLSKQAGGDLKLETQATTLKAVFEKSLNNG